MCPIGKTMTTSTTLATSTSVSFAEAVEVLHGWKRRSEPAGAETFDTMILAGKDANARFRADASVAEGQAFDFAVNMEKAVAIDPQTEERIA